MYTLCIDISNVLIEYKFLRMKDPYVDWRGKTIETWFVADLLVSRSQVFSNQSIKNLVSMIKCPRRSCDYHRRANWSRLPVSRNCYTPSSGRNYSMLISTLPTMPLILRHWSRTSVIARLSCVVVWRNFARSPHSAWNRFSMRRICDRKNFKWCSSICIRKWREK